MFSTGSFSSAEVGGISVVLEFDKASFRLPLPATMASTAMINSNIVASFLGAVFFFILSPHTHYSADDCVCVKLLKISQNRRFFAISSAIISAIRAFVDILFFGFSGSNSIFSIRSNSSIGVASSCLITSIKLCFL